MPRLTPLPYGIYNSIDLTQDLSKKHYKLILRGLFLDECIYCGYYENPSRLTVDHVIPKSKGGSQHINNMVIACSQCNLSKSDKDFLTWYPNQESFEQWRLDKILEWLSDDYWLDNQAC